MNKFKKLMIGSIIGLIASTSFAGETTADINVSGNITDTCYPSQQNYSLDFGTNFGPVINKRTLSFALTCPDGVAYTIKTFAVGGGIGRLNLLPFKDADTSLLMSQSENFISGVGNGNLQNVNIHYVVSGSPTVIYNTFQAQTLNEVGTIRIDY